METGQNDDNILKLKGFIHNENIYLELRVKTYQANPLIQFSAIVAGFISTTRAIAKFCNRLVFVVGQNREKLPMQINLKLFFNEEQEDWAKLTPEQRYIESSKLWPIYLELGGSFDPEPDSQSPFDFPELQRSIPAHGRPGVHFIRRI